jgi:hypothetical protein
VEHKSDAWAPATGNVAIEVEQKGNPSGLATTTAKWWALEVQDDVWIVIRTSVLRFLVAEAESQGRVKMVGDFNRYRNVLVPVEWLWRGATPVEGQRPAAVMRGAR